MEAALPPEAFAALKKHWGYTTLRPLQTEAVAAGLSGRDSLVVLPTGGGKSLCYQLPAILKNGLTVVVSPLIALMKDQVDSLSRIGVPAVRLDSSLDDGERFLAEQAIRDGEAKLAFTSPERLINSDVSSLLRSAGVHTVAIDEAHCVSHWGHDFRPEYRMLARLRELFPGAAIHAYTATATKKVQQDILDQLKLKNPQVLVGNFDRPNLTLRVLPQLDVVGQVREVLDRHRNAGGIIYCLRRKDVDSLAATLKSLGYKAMPYHAGMSPDERKRAQDAFVNETADVIVATIAFGMGIDRSNVRFVIHAAMPKSLEHYQQETGRAGRDGLPSDCVLLFAMSDVMTLRRIVNKSSEENNVEPAITAATLAQIDEMARFCRGATCRHKSIVSYFGQTYEHANCKACDVCLGDTDDLPDAQVVAQKILSCVARVKESFGIHYVVEVLRGSKAKNIIERGHEQLSTWGLLKTMQAGELKDYIHQLIGQELLTLTTSEYPVLNLTPGSWEVMRNQKTAKLLKLKATKPVSMPSGEATEVESDLFEMLRLLRLEVSKRLGVPPYIVFPDTVLKDMVRLRPGSKATLLALPGIGDKKLRDYGDEFLAAIADFCKQRNLSTDPSLKAPTRKVKISVNPSAAKVLSHKLFSEGASIDDVVNQTKLARSTLSDHLAEFIVLHKPKTVAPWVNEKTLSRVRGAWKVHGGAALKPLFEHLNSEVPYELIRIAVTFIENVENQ